ncbi:Uncharacterised protein [Mycobacteroides abscessus subsp. abscessus]|nr:Uncharacterised protein [Mycobacteroides abscessus subsp. abscessus]
MTMIVTVSERSHRARRAKVITGRTKAPSAHTGRTMSAVEPAPIAESTHIAGEGRTFSRKATCGSV